jgi:hypothetical protein
MRAGDHHHSSAGPDEKQSLLDNINQIKMHGSYPDTLGRDAVHNAITGVQGAFLGAKASAQDTLGWLRHALQDPDDFSSAAVGRMVSKAYGKHEPPHTEHHMWRSVTSPRSSPPSSPLGSTHSPTEPSSNMRAASSKGMELAATHEARAAMGTSQPYDGSSSRVGSTIQHAAGMDVVAGGAAGAARDQDNV